MCNQCADNMAHVITPGVTVLPTKLYSVYSLPIHIFIPGRICLFGEHSDWCTEYTDNQIEGAAIVVTTNLGIHALCTRIPDGKSMLYFKTQGHSQTVSLDLAALRQSATESSNFLRYVHGSAFKFLEAYGLNTLDSIKIVNFETTLPLKKGLSSSAAVCVLTIRSLSILLLGSRIPAEKEMDLAYEGERLTGSLCGRLDQICALLDPGKVALLSFSRNGDAKVSMSVSEILQLNTPFYLVIANVGGVKNTTKILASLQSKAAGSEGENIRKLFGDINANIVTEACRLLKIGNEAKALGALATRAQALFDQYALPACVSELTAPALHSLLHHPFILENGCGGKGVGAGGDGTAQIITNSAFSQLLIVDFARDILGLEAWPITIL